MEIVQGVKSVVKVALTVVLITICWLGFIYCLVGGWW
jgi:hypothetical protein